MSSLDALFADLLAVGESCPPPAHGEIGESGETQALARLAGHQGSGEPLANSGERAVDTNPDSPLFATHSPATNRPQSKQRRGFSPDSPDSPPPNDPHRSPQRLPEVGGWSDDETQAFVARRDRLMRWGWPLEECERLATRLALRHRDDDDRISCMDCAHYQPGRCGNHVRAGLNSNQIGRDLASMLQRCYGYQTSARASEHVNAAPSAPSRLQGRIDGLTP